MHFCSSLSLSPRSLSLFYPFFLIYSCYSVLLLSFTRTFALAVFSLSLLLATCSLYVCAWSLFLSLSLSQLQEILLKTSVFWNITKNVKSHRIQYFNSLYNFKLWFQWRGMVLFSKKKKVPEILYIKQIKMLKTEWT